MAALSSERARPQLHPVADLEMVPAESAVAVLNDLVSGIGDGTLRVATLTVEHGPGREDERMRDLRQRLSAGSTCAPSTLWRSWTRCPAGDG